MRKASFGPKIKIKVTQPYIKFPNHRHISFPEKVVSLCHTSVCCYSNGTHVFFLAPQCSLFLDNGVRLDTFILPFVVIEAEGEGG